MSDRAFTHPNLGKQITIKRHGRDVTLTFTCNTRAQADDLVDHYLKQLKAGALQITVMGKPSSVTET